MRVSWPTLAVSVLALSGCQPERTVTLPETGSARPASQPLDGLTRQVTRPSITVTPIPPISAFRFPKQQEQERIILNAEGSFSRTSIARTEDGLFDWRDSSGWTNVTDELGAFISRRGPWSPVNVYDRPIVYEGDAILSDGKKVFEGERLHLFSLWFGGQRIQRHRIVTSRPIRSVLVCFHHPHPPDEIIRYFTPAAHGGFEHCHQAIEAVYDMRIQDWGFTARVTRWISPLYGFLGDEFLTDEPRIPTQRWLSIISRAVFELIESEGDSPTQG